MSLDSILSLVPEKALPGASRKTAKHLVRAFATEGRESVPVLQDITQIMPENTEGLGEAFAHSAGLTGEEGYEGWIPLSVLTYEYALKPTYSILLGVDRALNSVANFLDGKTELSWLQQGVKALESAF